MISRNLLDYAQRVFVLLDSRSIDALLRNGDRVATALVTYAQSDILDFVRTPLDSPHRGLKRKGITEWRFMEESKKLNPVSVETSQAQEMQPNKTANEADYLARTLYGSMNHASVENIHPLLVHRANRPRRCRP